MTGIFPKNRIQPPEYRSDAVIPAPLEIVSQVTHPRDTGRKGRPDKEFLNRLNLKGHVLDRDYQIYHQAMLGPRPMDVLKVLPCTKLSGLQAINFSLSLWRCLHS